MQEETCIWHMGAEFWCHFPSNTITENIQTLNRNFRSWLLTLIFLLTCKLILIEYYCNYKRTHSCRTEAKNLMKISSENYGQIQSHNKLSKTGKLRPTGESLGLGVMRHLEKHTTSKKIIWSSNLLYGHNELPPSVKEPQTGILLLESDSCLLLVLSIQSPNPKLRGYWCRSVVRLCWLSCHSTWKTK